MDPEFTRQGSRNAHDSPSDYLSVFVGLICMVMAFLDLCMKSVVHLTTFYPQLDFYPPAWGNPQLFSRSYPPAIHANFGAWLRVKSTILEWIFWVVFFEEN